MCIGALHSSMSVRMFDPLELELEAVLNLHVDDRN